MLKRIVGCVLDWRCYVPTVESGHIMVWVESSKESEKEDRMYVRNDHEDMTPLRNWRGGAPETCWVSIVC